MDIETKIFILLFFCAILAITYFCIKTARKSFKEIEFELESNTRDMDNCS